MKSFQITTKVWFGDGALDRLREVPWRRVFVVADPFVVKSGVIRQVTERLEAAGAAWEVFDQVVPDPPVEGVAAGVRAMMGFKPEALVAIGGGSALDSAKLIREFAARMENGVSGVAMVAIPTTSGTGSEATNIAVLTDAERQVKLPITSDDLLPDEAILETELVKSVPPALTADTGMDVFTHAAEAIVSKCRNDFTDALAEKAVAIVGAYLLRSWKNAGDARARERMHSAACLAGMAFNASSLGLNHGMAHALGARFHIPHGRANAIVLPAVIAFNAGMGEAGSGRPELSPAARGYAKIARILGLQGGCPELGTRALVHWVRFMRDEMGVPGRVSQAAKCGEDEYMAAVPEMAAAAVADNCTEGNPVPASREDVAALFRSIW